jgi:Mrp family chromosome partitioning ATPase
MSKPAAFKQADVERALKACRNAGLAVAGIEVNDNGFVVLVGEGTSRTRKNPLDRLHAA